MSDARRSERRSCASHEAQTAPSAGSQAGRIGAISATCSAHDAAEQLMSVVEEPHSRRAAFPFSADAAKEFVVTRLSIMLTIAAVLAGAAPAPASAQQQGAPLDQGNGNWDPPPVTSPITQR
jgi:hypothetical protein